MSKNAKNSRVIRAARDRKMKKGPSSTKKTNTKVHTWYNKSSPTFWENPKEVKKGRSEDERAALTFFRQLQVETEKAHRLQKMRENLGV